MKADLAKLRALHEAATPGPWGLHPRAETTVLASDGYSATNTESNLFDSRARNEANAALIVAAVNALPELLAIAEAVERDALRYRWLRDRRTYGLCVRTRGDNPIHPHLWAYYEIDGKKLDAAIDRLLAIGEDG